MNCYPEDIWDSDLALTDLHGLGVFDRYNEIRMDISVFPGFRRCTRFAFAETELYIVNGGSPFNAPDMKDPSSRFSSFPFSHLSILLPPSPAFKQVSLTSLTDEY